MGEKRPAFCEDWACPSRSSCARHFGRSKAYAEMRESPRLTLMKGPREPTAEICALYERDKVKAWLKGPATARAALTGEERDPDGR